MTILDIIEPNLRVVKSFSEDWMLFVFIIILLLIGYVRFRFSRSFSDLFSTIVNVNKLREIMRQELVITSAASQILLVSSLLSLALFFYVVFKIGNVALPVNLDGFLLFLLILISCALIYMLKHLVIRVIQITYKGDFSLNEYMFNVNLFLKVAGIVIIPITIILAFTSGISPNALCYTGLGVIILSMIWRYWRGLQNAIMSGVSIFYIILYLCAFEILPVLTVIKFIL